MDWKRDEISVLTCDVIMESRGRVIFRQFVTFIGSLTLSHRYNKLLLQICFVFSVF